GKLAEQFAGAKVRLTLERLLASEPTDLAVVPPDPGAARTQALLTNHQRANRFVLHSEFVTADQGRFEVRLMLPDKLPWPKLLLRAYATTDRHEALGVLPLEMPK